MNERQTAEWLMEREDFLILTHVRPDGDTIGCAAGLCLALRGRGKTAWVLENPEATSLFTPYLEGLTAPEGWSPDTVVSVDIAARGCSRRTPGVTWSGWTWPSTTTPPRSFLPGRPAWTPGGRPAGS